MITAAARFEDIKAAIRASNIPLTEDAAALKFAELYGDRLRYCVDHGCWFRWDGSIWRIERTGLAFHYARELARDLSKTEDLKGLVAASKTAFAGGVERFARADPVFARTADSWDRDPMLAGTPDGTLDLRSGLIEHADPNSAISKSLAVGPAERADCPLWIKFLGETFGNDPELIRFIQQFLGYSLTGSISEHALVFGVGGGRNGKSVLLNTAARVMGDYAITAPMDTFTASRGDKHPTDLAMLRGARFVTASETEDGKAWAESRIKQLTGGDTISARFMRENFFSFQPTFKLFIVGNHSPALTNVDEAARRRFNIVPFSFRPDNPDPDLEEKLKAEWPAILRWMIDGCLDWQANRLVRPASVAVATDTYFHDQDLIGQWLDDECDAEPGNPHKWEPSSLLFKSWTAFAERSGEAAGTNKTFAESMRRRGFEHHRGTGGQRQFRGLQLRRRSDTSDAW
jgi:putative DNA primase/helicase